MNSVAKAVMAALAAMVACADARHPADLQGWAEVIGAGLGAGMITWYVPNTPKPPVPPVQP